MHGQAIGHPNTEDPLGIQAKGLVVMSLLSCMCFCSFVFLFISQGIYMYVKEDSYQIFLPINDLVHYVRHLNTKPAISAILWRHQTRRLWKQFSVIQSTPTSDDTVLYMLSSGNLLCQNGTSLCFAYSILHLSDILMKSILAYHRFELYYPLEIIFRRVSVKKM